MLINFIRDLGLYKIIDEQKELKQYFGLIRLEEEINDNSEQDIGLAIAQSSLFSISEETITDAIRLIVFKKEESMEPNCQQCTVKNNILTKDGLHETELVCVSKIDEIMSESSFID